MAHGVLSFFYTTAVVALTVNMAASSFRNNRQMTAIHPNPAAAASRSASRSRVLAQRLKLAPSILLVVAGIVLALVPGLPQVELAPEFVLLVILPPLIYSAGVPMSWREFRFNLRPIALLAIGCVLFTTCAVAAAASRAARLAMGRRLSRSAPSWRRRTSSRRWPSRGDSVCRGGLS